MSCFRADSDTMLTSSSLILYSLIVLRIIIRIEYRS